jgi:hypothetical protein
MYLDLCFPDTNKMILRFAASCSIECACNVVHDYSPLPLHSLQREAFDTLPNEAGASSVRTCLICFLASMHCIWSLESQTGASRAVAIQVILVRLLCSVALGFIRTAV